MRTVLLISVFLIVISCKEITYPVPQPAGRKNLKAVPEKLHGLFLMIGKEDDKPDTVLITSDGFHNPKKLQDLKEQTLLGDSLVIREYKSMYFVSEALNTKLPNWRMAIIKPLGNGDFQVQTMKFALEKNGRKSFNQLCLEVGKIVPIDSTRSEDLYQINPTPKQLMKLIRKGYYEDVIALKRIQ